MINDDDDIAVATVTFSVVSSLQKTNWWLLSSFSL
jgi:uncharacterized membrane protein YkvA (DUF1232 family)